MRITQDWAVTKLAHPALRDVREHCAECLALVDRAITIAAVTGCVGGSVEEAGHSASVSRALAVISR